MKIIVSSEKEAELMKRFVDYLCDIGIDILESEDEEEDEQLISCDEYKFLTDGFRQRKIEVGNTYSMCAENNIIIGTCTKCGKQTDGTLDGGDIAYDEYLEQNTEESRKNWLCEKCWRAEQ